MPTRTQVDNKTLFFKLYSSKTEEEVDSVIASYSEVFKQENWFPLGNNDNNFGVIENQQSSSIAALIEKITNAIDAILMKKCYEAGICPTSAEAPSSMEKAIEMFFAKDYKSWDLPSFRKKQSEDIQIIADGPRMNTSLVIYDNGEGQHPKDFEKSFLSLLTGNKKDIHFVQGKYNMGGSGAIVFCGKKSYQLIGSKKYDGKGLFGFTLIREHPLTMHEEGTKIVTWYEFLKIGNEIPSFDIQSLDLGLHNRHYKCGTVIKLFSYDLPAGSRSVISRDLNRSINEYLFEPALPVLTVDKKDRYPDDINLERDLYGLKRALEQTDFKYIDKHFSEEFTDDLFGKAKVSCYVFKTKVDGRSVKETKDSIRREFFRNNMSALFSINGQVHGNFTTEFITRSLKMNLLKDYLLIHVDCTTMKYSFRKELFMASRDRLKEGSETWNLRRFLAEKLGNKNGRLAEIEKRRRDSISVDSGDAKDLLKLFAKNLPVNAELLKLLGQTFKLDKEKGKSDKKEKHEVVSEHHKESFNPNRFPTFLKLKAKNDGIQDAAKIPINGEKTIRFKTDVEDQYFDRVEEPGELKIALLGFKQNESKGGDAPGKIETIDEVFNVNVSSPKQGTIGVTLNPKKNVKVGDALQVKVSLTAPGDELDQIFWVKISDQNAPKIESKKHEEEYDQNLGMPEYILAFKDLSDETTRVTWEKVEEATGEEMNYETVMYPLVEGETLEKIYINMDSSVLKNFKSKQKYANDEQLQIANKKYISSVYFHTLFLYTITKNRKFIIKQESQGKENDVDLSVYLKDLFASYYTEFILNFGTADLLQALNE